VAELLDAMDLKKCEFSIGILARDSQNIVIEGDSA